MASFARTRGVTLASLIVGYMGYYLCRQNFSAAYPLLHDQLGLGRATFGAVASTGTLLYALGKVVAGPLTDSHGGRRLFFIGLFGSVVATMMIGLLAGGAGAGLVALFVLWSVNRLFQSAGWGGVLSVLSRWYPRSSYGTAAGALSISYQVGGAVAAALCARLVAFGWRALFLGPAVALCALGLVLLPTLRGSPADAGLPPPEDPAAAPASPAGLGGAAGGPATRRGRVRSLLSRPAFLVVCALSLVLTLVRETFNTWLPAYFTDIGASAEVASVKAALFPLLGAVGTLLGGFVSDRLLGGRRGPVLVVFLLGAGVSLLGLARPAAVAAACGLPLPATALALTGATGFFILAPYSMVGGGVLALDAGGQAAAATAAGLLDAVGYLGATLAGVGVAEAVAHLGWGPSFAVLGALVLGAAVLSLVLWLLTERGPAT